MSSLSKVRIKNKRDTSANWEANNPVLLNGELIIVDTNAGDTRFKIGDGTKTYTQLPFQDEALYNVLNSAINNTYTKTETDALFAEKAPVPDWNQNDDKQPDYVKNRPFYTGDPVETVLVEESTVTFTENNGLYMASFQNTFEVTEDIVGETWKISWDGTVYECPCVDANGILAIGNLSIVGEGSDTGEPFVMGIVNGEVINIFTADTSASHTFSISRTVVPVVKIDKKYLVQPDWNQNDKTAADFVKNRPFYSETGNVTVENAVDVELERFPVFAIGDTVTVNVDGVKHSLVAYEDTGTVIIGDTTSSLNSGEGQLGWQIYVDVKEVWFYATEAHTVSYLGIDYHHKIDPKYLPLPVPFKPVGKSYLTFSSPNSFTLAVNDATKHWDGTLEFLTYDINSDKIWTTWDGTTTLSSVDNDGEYVLYLRGTGNTVITGSNSNYKWVLTGTDIKCIGNIENLLDYATVESGEHPTMAGYCYANMFNGCTSLIQASPLPATTLVSNCYNSMFCGCTALTQAPSLSATTLANSCYYSMFQGCTGLTQAPVLPATTLASYCYVNMFYNCTNLIQAPVLPATTLASYCYSSMFRNCTNLTQAPELPATTLAESCYVAMFYNCTNLIQAPVLPATTLANSCYYGMFSGCTSLKLSSTQTGEYTQEYRIPSFGEGVTATNALKNMFTSTGGTFTGTPEINTTYYLSSDNMIVRETEVATLNGYVESMIAAKAPVPDWNQSNETAADYIKNKPLIATNDDAIDFLAEMGMIIPVTNSNGEILTSPSNEIYSL